MFGHFTTLCMKGLTEGMKVKNLKTTLVFIDLKKVVDSIHGGKMLKILRECGMQELIVAAFGLLYTGTKTKVLSPDGEIEFFEISAGVL